MTWAAVGVVVAALAGQAFWIAHALAGVRRELDTPRGDVGGRLDRIDARLEEIERTVLRDHGERLARLEERIRS